MNATLQKWFEAHGEEIKDLSRKIWGKPEHPLEEYFACKTLSDYLEGKGFRID